ncbi:SH3 domain-containing protein [Sphingobacterium sp. HMA12]|uniref:SH3 domain-containing protein n=1 Tax=Sphingobacterium sp. HMA12 TaxID=2050894 RepID=UPI000CEA6026|nr:SH3 domain-containing protein [Sphingobacterium sp. HMA12]
MNLRNITLVCISLFPILLKAQDGISFDDDFNLWNIQKGQTTTIFVEKAYIRSGPGLSSKRVDSLSHGATVSIASDPIKGDIIKNFYAPWYQISYFKHGELKQGFIWLGLLALGKQVDKEGFQYLFGFDRFIKQGNDEEPAYFLTKLKVLNTKDSLIASQSYKFAFAGQLSAQSKLLSGMGLDNVKQILRMEFLSGACGVPTEYNYMAWTGQKLINLPSRYSVSDASFFYYDEKILFPSEHKRNNQLIYKYIEEGEAKDDDTLDPDYRISKREEHFQWDGNKFKKHALLK